MNVYYPQRYFCFFCQDFLKGNYCNSKLWSFNSHLKTNGHKAITDLMTAKPNDLMTAKLNDIKQCLQLAALSDV